MKTRSDALSKVIKATSKGSAKAVIYTTALLGMVALYPEIQLSPELAAIAGGLGVEAIGSILDRVAHDDGLTDEQIRVLVENTLAESDISELLTKDEFWHGFSHLRKAQMKISKQNQEILATLHQIDLSESAHSSKPSSPAEGYVFDRANYLSDLINELESFVGTLEYTELEGVGDAPADPKNHRVWELEFAELASLEDPSRKIRFNSIQDAASKHPRFVLVGEPGMGKTTTLRRLVLEQAHKALSNEKEPLPLFIWLPTWKIGEDITDLILSKLNLRTAPSDSFIEDDIVLFLDGLNELGASGKSKIPQLRSWVTSGQSTTRIIVTCRTKDYSEDMELGVPIVEIQELDDRRIRKFAEKYLGLHANQFCSQIFAESGGINPVVNLIVAPEHKLSHIARNPYLLAALIYIFDRASHKDLPDQPDVLFSALTKLLWKRERLRLGEAALEFEDVRRALSLMAFRMFYEDLPLEVPYAWAQAQVGVEVLRIGHNTSFLYVEVGYVRFSHRLLQEYFAANYIIEKCSKNHELGLIVELLASNSSYWCVVCTMASRQLCQILPKSALQTALGSLLTKPVDALTELEADNPYWWSVWLAGLLSSTIYSLQKLDQDAAQAVSEVQKQLVHLLEKVDALPISERSECGRFLGVLGDPRIGTSFIWRENKSFEWVNIPKGSLVYYEYIFLSDETLSLPVEPPVEVEEFYITKYPVTYSQYEPFVSDHGYSQRKYWSDEGWEWKQNKQQPDYWNDTRWHISNHPVVGICWYEAKAYCNWLSDKLGFKIRLPKSEEYDYILLDYSSQRVRSAYPMSYWGNHTVIVETRVPNNKAMGWQGTYGRSLSRTTAVGIYPLAQACGVYDILGNVSEATNEGGTHSCGWDSHKEVWYPPTYSRTSFVQKEYKEYTSTSHGFRLATNKIDLL